jgi:hypothetical protein
VLAVLLEGTPASVGAQVEFATGTAPGPVEVALPTERFDPDSAPGPAVDAPGEGALGHPVASLALHERLDKRETLFPKTLTT